MIIRPILDDKEARDFLNSVPYPERVPEWFNINTPVSFALGVYVEKLVGAFPLLKHENAIEINAAFLPEYRGKFAVDAAKEAFTWIWDNTSFRRIIADIQEPHVARYAHRCGMVKKGQLYEVEHGQIC